MQLYDTMERYYSLNKYLREKYGEKIYKLAIDSGLSCPNRDGTLDTRGCIFCSNGGSGDFSCKSLDEARAFLKHENPDDAFETKFTGQKYIAYYQSFSNTYAPVEKLEQIFRPAIQDDEVVSLAVATRPDCLPPFILDYLYELNRIKPIWVELGLQTIHPETAAFIRRDYALHTFETAVKNLRLIDVDVVAHLILGLPGESKKDMLESVRFLNTQDIQGVKLHLLHVLEGTDLGELYKKGLKKEKHSKVPLNDFLYYEPMTLDEYADLVCDCVGSLRPDIVIHRLTGDGPKKLLLSPLWSGDKKKVLNTINRRLEERDITQGCLL